MPSISSSSDLAAPSVSAAQTTEPGLRALLGEMHLRPALPADSIDGILPENVAEPGSARELAEALRICGEAGWCVIPRGNGSKMEWGNAPRTANLVLSTRHLNHLVEHAWGDLTATVETGCVFADVQRTLAERGQRLALDPLWPDRATVGGILATNDSGALRMRFGSLRDLIIGITLALPDGTLAKSGGKVVKNVAGYDLAKLATGSLGTLGIITQAIFRLHPVASHSRSLSFATPDTKMLRAVLAILDSQLTPSAVQVRCGSSFSATVDILLEGTLAGCDAQARQAAAFASSSSVSESDPPVWSARERLFENSPDAAICKVSLLPADLEVFFDELPRQSQSLQFSWMLVAQAVGVGLLRLDAGSVEGLRKAISATRRNLESRGGSVVVLQCPREIKSEMDVWGDSGDRLPLMKSIKHRFDPAGMLNPGRFVGGI